jgi:hypothetical protein
MNIPPLSHISSLAGTALAQSKGPQIDRVHHDAAADERRIEVDGKAANAEGIGATDGEEKETADRDADGRRLWEFSLRDAQPSPNDANKHPAQDPTALSGTRLDVAG